MMAATARRRMMITAAMTAGDVPFDIGAAVVIVAFIPAAFTSPVILDPLGVEALMVAVSGTSLLLVDVVGSGPSFGPEVEMEALEASVTGPEFGPVVGSVLGSSVVTAIGMR